jgi:CHAT domain-containing protein
MHHRRTFVWTISFLLCLCGATVAGAATPALSSGASAETLMSQGLSAYRQGDFGKAVEHFRLAGEAAAKTGNAVQQGEAAWRQAEAHRALGQHHVAVKQLETAYTLLEKAGNQRLFAASLASYGDSLGHIGDPRTAASMLARGIDIARRNQLDDVTAVGLNNLGNLNASLKQIDLALAAYRESSEFAARAGRPALQIKALGNAARLSVQTGNLAGAAAFLNTAVELVGKQAASRDKAHSLLGMGRVAWKLYTAAPQQYGEWFATAYKLFTEAETIAVANGDQRAASFASGYLGTMYEHRQRYVDALQLTQRAINAAAQIEAPESEYLWLWQAGRIYRAQNNIDAAIASYRLAVAKLQVVRTELSAQASFKDVVGPVFFELTDLLLQRPGSLSKKEDIEHFLAEARQTMELLKAAELQDYFQDNCVTALQSKITGLDKLESHTAVLYPILLKDRLEILISLAGGMERAVVPIGADELRETVTKFRRLLEKRTTHQYMPYARKIYDLTMRPIEPMLAAHNINTLVIVPDSSLRTIPISALHDGKEFLVARYALATTPGLTLTDPKPLKREKVNVLVGGLTESVQGFPALPNVNEELETIKTTHGGTILKDNQYVVNNVQQELGQKPYNIVHIASHAQFSSNKEDTFLLAYDDKLTMDRLEKLMGQTVYRDDPVELLTLSACQTAAGDDRAALGLAGIAIKAGARSALATLWFINDQASSHLVSEFYRQLKNPSLSKAQALQQAQLTMLKDKRYRHPIYWSPFLLIGNWL